ncbi:hypothetical protein SpAn4DRAFT_3170 [Sporomusa ovata]|uniref:Uncharacterized protein n=1 Tax=Sporomusa ovata TaxID=2378 RepID=A0A0U1KZ62_9FIRM|nr:hypothetical protein SpAn4DRAFT_3170 [Sporomusa ovata]
MFAAFPGRFVDLSQWAEFEPNDLFTTNRGINWLLYMVVNLNKNISEYEKHIELGIGK